MAKRIPIGIDNFAELTDKKNNYLFVDKTLMLKEFCTDSAKVSLILRPRRWGKTLNMSMLQHFFAATVNGLKTKGLFDHLNIAHENQGEYLAYQGKNPVLFISFKDIKPSDFNHFIEQTKELIQELCAQHSELETSEKLTAEQKHTFKKLLTQTSNQSELEKSLKTLSTLLQQHYGAKTFILIDEYDSPLNLMHQEAHFTKISDFFNRLFGSALKGNDALEKGIITGILKLSKNNMLSGLNNLSVYSLMEKKYSQWFGFSETEVQNLFTEQQLSVSLQEVRRWYNGYTIGNLYALYNPWSIINCIENKGALKPYWIKTGDSGLLKTAISDKALEEEFNTLLSGKPIRSKIEDHISFEHIKEGGSSIVWSLLWSLGYLKIMEHPDVYSDSYELKIPNYEVQYSYQNIFIEFIRAVDQRKYDNLLNSLLSGNIDTFKQHLSDFLLMITSYRDLNSEKEYHALFLAWTFSLQSTHKILSNKEVGLGRPDLILAPILPSDDLGLILEFKYTKPGQTRSFYESLAEAGLQQIHDKKYDTELKKIPKIKRILKLSIAFYGKEFICAHNLEYLK